MYQMIVGKCSIFRAMKKTILCFYFVSLGPSNFVKSFSEVITPKSIRDGNFEVFRSWLVYVDSNLVNALMTCFFNRKRNYFNQMRTCLMNCSPSCLKMQLHLSPPCLQPKVMFLDEIRQWKKNWGEIKYLALKNVERYYYSGIPCFFRRDLTQYRMDHFAHYVGRMIFDFLTDASLRINVTHIDFDVTLMKRGCSKK